MIRVLIADDHTIVRSGLKQIFAVTTDIEFAGEACSGEDLMTRIPYAQPDLILLDLTMPGLSGLPLLYELQTAYPDLPVLILSMHNEAQIVSRTLKAGARAYITKGCEPEILLAAIRKVADGGRFLDPSLAGQVALDSGGQRHYVIPILSLRERQVLELIAAGHTLTDIADHLGVSPKTISTHKMRLMQKLEISNNADLLRYATQLALLSA